MELKAHGGCEPCASSNTFEEWDLLILDGNKKSKLLKKKPRFRDGEEEGVRNLKKEIAKDLGRSYETKFCQARKGWA